MAKLSIRLDKRRTNKKGLQTIQFLITHRQKNTTISTGYHIKYSHFHGEFIKVVKNCCPNAKFLNNDIASLYLKYLKLMRDLEYSDEIQNLSVTQIKQILIHGNGFDHKCRPSFSQYFEDYLNKRTLTDSTYKSYLYAKKRLDAYTLDKKLYFEDLTAGFLKQMNETLSQTLSINSRATIFRQIRSVYNRAIDDGICSIDSNPFRAFKVRMEYRDKRYLTIEKLRQLKELTFKKNEEKLRMSRDLFLLSFYFCGINAIDLYSLPKSINSYIFYSRRKTLNKNSNIITLFIQPEAAEIIKQYEGQNSLLNCTEIYKSYNTFQCGLLLRIRHLGELIGVNNLTFYWARYSWATLADSIGIDEKVISKSLGHTERTMAGKYYIFYDWKRSHEANRKLLDYLNQD